MSKPIPIGSSPTTPPLQPPSKLPMPGPSNSPTSSFSTSPQTPFYPAGLSSPPMTGPGAVGIGGMSTTAPPNAGFFKWASSFSKSPSAPDGLVAPPPSIATMDETTPRASQGFGARPGGALFDDDDTTEQHDSFEFGDWNDLKSRTWHNSSRRAMSMSLPRGQSGISAMLSANPSGRAVSASAQGAATTGAGGVSGTQGAMSPPPLAGGVMADKLAKGQGVLRRISFSNGLALVSVCHDSPPFPSMRRQHNMPSLCCPYIRHADLDVASLPLLRAAVTQGPNQQPILTSHQRSRCTGPSTRRGTIAGRRVVAARIDDQWTSKRGAGTEILGIDAKEGCQPCTWRLEVRNEADTLLIQMGERLLRDHGHF